MTLPASRFFAASVSTLTSIVVLIVLVLFLAGPAYFGGLLLGSVWHIVIISIIAGLVRLPFRRGGLSLSAACGTLVAVAGFLVILAFAISRI